MKQHIKAAWLEALRSGMYQRGIGVMHRSPNGKVHEFCPLGVLCDLAVLDGVDIEVTKPNSFYFYDGVAHCLSTAVLEWAGLESALGVIPGSLPTYTITDLNDNGMTFEEIADVIEREF